MNEAIARIDQMAGTGMAFMENMTVLIVLAVVGLIIGLFGLKLVRVWATLIGFVLGAAAGGGIGRVAGLSDMAFVGAILAGAVLFAVLACIFYKVGIFLFILLAVSGLCLAILQADSLLLIVISLVIGLVVAIVTMIVFDPMVIIVTSIEGGFMAGNAIAALTGLGDNLILSIVIPIVLIVICAWTQFIMRSRQVGKRQAKKAKEHRQQASRETEVEQARMLLDDETEQSDVEKDEDEYSDEDEFDEDEEGYLDEDEFEDEYYYDEDDLEDDEDFKIIK